MQTNHKNLRRLFNCLQQRLPHRQLMNANQYTEAIQGDFGWINNCACARKEGITDFTR